MSDERTVPHGSDSRVAALGAVVFDAPDHHAAARFWRELTGGTVDRAADDWVSVVTPDGWGLDFQPAPDLVPPQWPGQDHPQQLHLDLRVPDVAAATTRAVALGATVLRENPGWTTLADPAGHPFDLCHAPDNDGLTVMGVTFDVPDASAAAAFWSRLLGEPVVHDSDGTAMLGGQRALLFQQVEGYTAPRWPDPAFPQQVHLDLVIGEEGLDVAEAAALDAGATRLPGNEDTFRVFADPAGHPFCLCTS
ncbi:VOC family protein [Isoptericola sp. NEAU-Y5]|uniref:VOC family protein n=1 Tax=Isoptericola luteus TaxID=2879484 RepID=A0ABS7ZBL8_9MICO|nr:VOC family protein [Isoptericola sp. NEAU-Y5]MCA5891867.1 VOC family protein [Isoptericola sp. NEAU-Y5]